MRESTRWNASSRMPRSVWRPWLDVSCVAAIVCSEPFAQRIASEPFDRRTVNRAPSSDRSRAATWLSVNCKYASLRVCAVYTMRWSGHFVARHAISASCNVVFPAWRGIVSTHSRYTRRCVDGSNSRATSATCRCHGISSKPIISAIAATSPPHVGRSVLAVLHLGRQARGELVEGIVDTRVLG